MEEFKRTKKRTGVQAYYSALRKIFGLERTILTGVLPTSGERGRNDEERLRQFLTQILPKRFGIGTGFIVSGEPSASPSNQTDIIIADQWYNSPIHTELAAQVYPIETVLATIEVKGTLSSRRNGRTGKTDLGSTLDSISKVRDLAQDKQYTIYKSTSKEDDQPDHKIVSTKVLKSTLPPRSFLFAYHTDEWKKIDSLGDYIERCLLKHEGAHLHGVVVLNRDWFFKQKPYTGRKRHVSRETGDCLLKFTNALLHGIQSIPMYPLDIDVYHDPTGPHFEYKDDSGFMGEVEEEESEDKEGLEA